MSFSLARFCCLIPFSLFANTVVWTSTHQDPLSPMTNAALAMQQIQSLIPEKIWEQEFSLLLPEEAYQKVLPKWMEKHAKEIFDTPCSTIGQSGFYLVRSTMSGEPVRLLDRFQEFQYSPFWTTPENVSILDEREKKELLP